MRIGVELDGELAAALERARPLLNGSDDPAALLRALALLGAEGLSAGPQDAAERLIAWSSGEQEPPWDPEVLGRVDELAWGHGLG